MAKAKGKACVRYLLNKVSHVAVIANSSKPFTSKTDVTSVVDGATLSPNIITWTAKKLKVTAAKMHIQLIGQGLPPMAGGLRGTPPDAGTLSITLTDPSMASAPPVDDMPVEYVDDPT
jgi:hypothetical protein